MINSNLTRLQWLKQTQIKYMKEGNYKFSAFYGRLFHEQWEVENPVEVLNNNQLK